MILVFSSGFRYPALFTRHVATRLDDVSAYFRMVRPSASQAVKAVELGHSRYSPSLNSTCNLCHYVRLDYVM